MKNHNLLDYEDVCVVLKDNILLNEDITPNLHFEFGNLNAKLPVILFYNSNEINKDIEKICEEAGVLTCGAIGSRIPYASSFTSKDNQDLTSSYLYEVIDPTTLEAKIHLDTMFELEKNIIVGCSVSNQHGLRLAERNTRLALLVGATQTSTFKQIEMLGMMIPRISMVQELSKKIQNPIFVTAASASETSKALIAGADAVVINIGEPSNTKEDLKFIVDNVIKSLYETIETLCKLCGTTNYQNLSSYYCLVPK